jgi:hypothetical protein
VVLGNEHQAGQNPERFITPAPVKAVLRAGYISKTAPLVHPSL